MILCFSCKYHRHPMMNWSYDVVSSCCNNSEGLNGFTGWIPPRVPQACKSEGFTARQTNPRGHFSSPMTYVAPFVKTVGNNQTPTPKERATETWFFREGLRAGIDHPVANFRILRPMRN